MPIRALASRKVKAIFYVIFLSTFALLLYYGAWKMTSNRSADNKLDATAMQTTRKKSMEEYCRTHAYETKPSSSRESLGYIIVDDEHKILYCTIPKVSTTTWKAVFAELRGIKVNNVKEVHTWNLWKRLYQYTEEERAERLHTYFKFLFVREPLKRLLSAYKDKFTGNDTKMSTSYRREIVNAYRPQDLNKRDYLVSFPEFIKFYSNDVPRNQHWRQYEKLCHPCYVNYSFIGHLETMEEDAALVLKMAGIDDRATFPPIHKSTNSSEVLEYYSQVPAEYITQIGLLYRSDFEMFGYEYLGPVKPLL